MNVARHLTKNQLAGYSKGSLPETEARVAGRHLLQCDACRKLMPMPQPERFISVLMTENDLVAAGTTTTITAAAAEKTVFRTGRSLHAYLAVFNSPAGFAWSAGALVLILTITTFLWIYAGRQQTTIGEDNGEIAQINPAGREVINPPVLVPSPVSTVSSNSGSSGDHPERSTGNDNSLSGVNGVKQVGHKDKPLREMKRDSQPDRKLTSKSDRSFSGSNSGANRVVVSTSRSLNDCPPGAPEIVLSPYFETVTEKQPVLRWKPVRGAVQYELYVSDSEQILVEKGEVRDDTSFRLKKELEANKSYKWKVIAILPDNKRLSSDSINFSVGGAAWKYSPKKIREMKINPTRCGRETTKSEP